MSWAWATEALDKVRYRTLEQAEVRGPQRPLGGDQDGKKETDNEKCDGRACQKKK